MRKLGKLPADVVRVEYDLEYGSATLEMHKDAIAPGARVLIVDDLLATGGTVAGTIELVIALQGEIVALAFLIELTFLKDASACRVTTSARWSATSRARYTSLERPTPRRPAWCPISRWRTHDRGPLLPQIRIDERVRRGDARLPRA